MKTVKLQEVCDFINGDRGKNYPKASEFTQIGVPFINAGHIEDNSINFSGMNYISEEVYNKLGSGKLEFGDIVFCLRGSLGKSAIVNFKEGAIASSLVIIRNKNENILSTTYLMYILSSEIIFKQIEKNNTGSSQPNLSANNVKNFLIPLPSLDRQIELVELFDKMNELINKRQTQIQALDELTQSLFLEMFGDPVTNSKEWKLKTLKDFGEWKSGGTPSKSNKNYYSGQIPWLSSGELNDVYVESSAEYITEQAVKESATKFIEEGSILLGMYDTAALKSSIVKMRCTCNQAIAFAKLDDEKVSTLYIYNYIQLAKDHLKRQQRGVRQKNMNLSMIKDLMVMYPPIELQREFEEKFQLIQEKKVLLTDSLEHLNMLYNSLLQKSFKGELFQD